MPSRKSPDFSLDAALEQRTLGQNPVHVPAIAARRLFPHPQAINTRYLPQHFLYFLPLPQGQGALLKGLP